MKYTKFIALLLILMACNNQPEKEGQPETIPVEQPETVERLDTIPMEQPEELP